MKIYEAWDNLPVWYRPACAITRAAFSPGRAHVPIIDNPVEERPMFLAPGAAF